MDSKIGRRASLGLMAGLAAVPIAASAAGRKGQSAMPLPDITIYHLEGRRSERIVWLMEELGLPYKLEFKAGDLRGSMASIKAINPIAPMAPTVMYGKQVLVESEAIIDLILQRHAPGKLVPALDSADYPYHLIWMAFAEGSLAARIFADYFNFMSKPPTTRSPFVDSVAVMDFTETFLADHPWFGGAEFSAADIMMKFPTSVALGLNVVDEEKYPKIKAWLAKCEERPAHIRMRAKALPNGMVGSLPRLPQHAPPGDRPELIPPPPQKK